MWEIIRDPIWQFIGAILALAAIFISIGLYLRQRRRKAMSYEIVSQTPLLSMEEEVKGKLKILFEDEPVQKVHLIVAKVINSGNLSILPTDYQRPVSFGFDNEARVLTAEVIETNPDSLEASIGIEGKKVVFEPTLLNEKDSITLKMLVSQFDGQVTVDGRIVGVKDIRKFTEWPVHFILATVIGFGLFSISLIGFVLYLARLIPTEIAQAFLLPCFVLGSLLNVIGALGDREMRKRFRIFLGFVSAKSS